jgi:O-Antigen ligase
MVGGLVIGVIIGPDELSALAAVVLAGVAFVAAFGWPRAAVLVALALGMLQYGPTKSVHLVPQAFTVLDDFLLFALGLRWVAGVAARRVDPPVWVTTWLLIWMGVGALSAAARGISITTTLVSYRWMFLPAVFYMVCAHYGRQGHFARDVIRVVVGVGLLQAAVAIMQAGIARSIGDSSYGLLGPGGANALGFLILLATVLVATNDNAMSKSVWLVIVSVMGIISAQARAAIIALPFVLILAYRGRLKRPLAALVVTVIVVSSVVMVAVAFQKSGMNASRDLSPQRLVAAQLQSPNGGGGRLVPALRLPGLFGASPLGWIAGLGPGQYGSAFRQIPWMLHYSYQIANSEWTVIWGEYGLIGLLSFLAILSRPLRISIRLRADDGPDWTRQMARAAPSIVFVGVVGMTVLTILEYQPFSYPLWALLGLLEAASAVSVTTASALSRDRAAYGDADGPVSSGDDER